MHCPALPLTPTTELMLMIEPVRCRIMIGVTAWMKLNADLRLTLRTASQSLSFIRMSSVSLVIPALLMRMSMRPKSLLICSITVWVSSKLAAFEA